MLSHLLHKDSLYRQPAAIALFVCLILPGGLQCQLAQPAKAPPKFHPTVESLRAYNMSGNQGVQLVFKNGKKLLIGSQKADELAEAIRSIMKSS